MTAPLYFDGYTPDPNGCDVAQILYCLHRIMTARDAETGGYWNPATGLLERLRDTAWELEEELDE